MSGAGFGSDTMTDTRNFQISRRKVLAGLGTVGIASAGAGLGTSAFFSDEESVQAILEAGRVDLRLDYRSTYVPWLPIDDVTGRLLGPDMGPVAPLAGEPDRYHVDSVPVPQAADADNAVAAAGFALNADGTAPSAQAWGDAVKAIDPCADDLGLLDGDEGLALDLIDVKPYDVGETTFSLHLCGNPSYLYTYVTNFETPENDYIEPEVSAADPTGPSVEGPDMAGELHDYLYVRVYYDGDCDNQFDEDPAVGDDLLFQGSLDAFVEFVRGAPDGRLPLSRSPTAGTVPARQAFEAGNYCYVLEWEFPCKPEDFRALPSDAPVPDLDEEGDGVTMADELFAKGLPLDANVAQTDGVTLGLGFHAVQTRHNMDTDVPDEGECLPCEFDVPAGEDDAAEVVSINASAFPQVDVFARVDSVAGTSGDLIGAFDLCEDDCQQDPVASFTSVDQQVDIAFLVDVTGSMGDEIVDVRNNLTTLVNDIVASGTDAQYAVQLYADDDDDGVDDSRIDTQLYQDLTADVSEIDAALADAVDEVNNFDSGTFANGGDFPEDAYSAIADVDGSLAGGSGPVSWRTGSQRVVVVLSDANADTDDIVTRSDVVDILNGTTSGSGASGYTFIAVVPSSPEAFGGEDLRVLAEDPAVGGRWIDLRSSNFSAVLAEIADAVTTTYRLRYTSTDPTAASGDSRTVTISVTDPDEGVLFDTGTANVP